MYARLCARYVAMVFVAFAVTPAFSAEPPMLAKLVSSDIYASASAMNLRDMLQNDPEGLRADTWVWAADFRASNPLT